MIHRGSNQLRVSGPGFYQLEEEKRKEDLGRTEVGKEKGLLPRIGSVLLLTKHSFR